MSPLGPISDDIGPEDDEVRPSLSQDSDELASDVEFSVGISSRRDGNLSTDQISSPGSTLSLNE